MTRRLCLLVMPAEGGQTRVVVPESKEHPLGVRGIAWSADARFLYYWGADGKTDDLFRVAAEGGQPENLGVRGEQLGYLSVHPDGQRIIYSSGQSKVAQEVWVLENFFPPAK